MLLAVLDGSGLHGSLFVYGTLAAMMGSHLLVFVYLWRNGRLDMEEDPKYQMLNKDETEG